ncbi:MAG: exodeoxyribonuclease III [Candidatus Shapirobacteria bacterium]|nr:exodeoxyribonuclease III [Candidatus Shapirobacteria bacterium]MDD5073644.1 exodeoxyribonuclease III [Candidatus Shapirobacteria bacterium]MDD5481395.1 exodeoxyribonuclease III [Candidatus Shapirobacteria bacterium]
MKIISWNINGFRAIYQKDFLTNLKTINPDIIGLQEIKAKENQLPANLLRMAGYQLILNPAKRAGYSGTAVYSKKEPKSTNKSLGLDRFDNEGRLIELEFENFNIMNLYLPNGGRQKQDMGYKLKVYDRLFSYIKDKKSLVLIGDFNIAHQPIDLARPVENKNNTGFTPKEREKIDQLLDLGFVDTFRLFNKEGGNYSFWAYFARARERNIGWRIDYCFVSQDLKEKVKEAFILPKVLGSDHCPVGIALELF